MEKHILSKSTYIKGEQCLKQLFMHKKHSSLRDRMPAERLAIFSRGTKVGVYAQELFPGGIDAGPKHPSQYRKALIRTQELLQAGQEVIYEAAFQADRTLILLDILIKKGDKWDAYEVKSSLSLSETYYKDAALQYYVLKNAGLKINTFSLVHINKEYERKGEINKNELFVFTDVTEEVENRYFTVKKNIENQQQMLLEENAPSIDIGKHCFEPYDCDFIGHCWKSVKKPSIFDIPSIDIDQQFELYNEYGSLQNIMRNADELDQYQVTEIDCQLNNQLHFELSEESISDFEEYYNEGNDFYALKILSFTPALPLYDNTKPYQRIAFAYAMMPIDGSKPAEIFISDGNKNHEDIIIERLNSEAEQKQFFSYNNQTEDINTIDLLSVIDNGEYYHPAMVKDYSNKSLSKALGIRAAWKSIESDIVAAQYYDEILRGHKKSVEKYEAIKTYLVKEVELVVAFIREIVL